MGPMGGVPPAAAATMGSKAAAYKTILCKNYVENKQCSFGQKCQFAHGHHELRQMQSPAAAMAGPAALNSR